MAALLLSLENGRHAMFRRTSLYVIPITLLREAGVALAAVRRN